ncbi:hypothetical protein V6N13_005536 [Hibiscus sabdariffa]|uniref:Uncharacterized protein n=1 Tax=Hibiscus sabdariffa TaxID=183260 RepID=A0ABR2EQE3_9ROSI
MALPHGISYLYHRRKEGPGTKLFFMKPPVFVASVVLGLLAGIDDFLYAYGVARLPISTSALIISTQLAFAAAFAFLLVKPKFTAFTINSIFLLTLGAVVLALHTSSDRPANESKLQFFMGFFTTLGASALYGFVLPAIELTYKKAKQTVTYSLVMEMQMVIQFQGRQASMSSDRRTVNILRRTRVECDIMADVLHGSRGSDFLGLVVAVGYNNHCPASGDGIVSSFVYHEKFQGEKGLALVHLIEQVVCMCYYRI